MAIAIGAVSSPPLSAPRLDAKAETTHRARQQAPRRMRRVQHDRGETGIGDEWVALFFSSVLEARARFEMSPHLIDIYL